MKKAHLTYRIFGTILSLSIAGLSQAAIKVGVVDFERALQGVKKGKEAKARLEKKFKDKKSKFEKQKKDFETAQEEFKKKSLVLSDKAKNDQMVALQKKFAELQEQLGTNPSHEWSREFADCLSKHFLERPGRDVAFLARHYYSNDQIRTFQFKGYDAIFYKLFKDLFQIRVFPAMLSLTSEYDSSTTVPIDQFGVVFPIPLNMEEPTKFNQDTDVIYDFRRRGMEDFDFQIYIFCRSFDHKVSIIYPCCKVSNTSDIC